MYNKFIEPENFITKVKAIFESRNLNSFLKEGFNQSYLTKPLLNIGGIDSILVSGFSDEIYDKKIKQDKKSDSVIIICNPNAINYANMYLGVSTYTHSIILI